MAFRLFLVTQNTNELRKAKSRLVGFVTAFGWESEQAKVRAKYPEVASECELHEVPKSKRRFM